MTTPLLIGGATTSKAHTAVKIAPAYSGPVVHVLDASRAVGVAGALVDAATRDAFAAGDPRPSTTPSGATARAASRRSAASPIAEARANRVPIDWSRRSTPPRPTFLGVRTFDRLPARRARRAHRLDAVLRDLGAARRVPGDPRRPEGRRRGARPVSTTRATLLERIVGEDGCARERRRRLLAGQRRRDDDIAAVARRARAATAGDVPHAPPADGQDRRPTERRARRLRGADRQRAAPTTSARSRSRPVTGSTGRTDSSRSSRPPTTTTRRSSPRRSPTGSPRRSRSGSTSASGASCGATRPTRR